MEDMTFDISGILSDEEADKFFEDIESEQQEETEEQPESPEVETEQPAEEEEEETQPSERVGEEEVNDESEGSTAQKKGTGSSPTVYSSIAEALKKDGIFPDFEDEELEAVKTPEDFADLFERAINARVDGMTRRINDAMRNGVQPDVIRQYEQTIGYLNSINDDAITAEGDEADDLRKSLIYNDLINKGYSDDRARREIDKSFKAGSDIDDAKDALEALRAYYINSYQAIQDDAKKRNEEFKANQKKQSDDFKKMILEDEIKIGDSKLDKRTCQKVYDAVSKPVYKDPDSGKLLTAVQKFQKEQPLEFLKQLGMWFVLTEGGKSVTALTKKQLQTERNKGIRELERKINSSSFSGGSLRYDGGNSDTNGDDILLSDNWKIA